MNGNGKDISSNVIWRLLERFSAKGVTFVVSIILARLLEPSLYGTIALVSVFTTILDVFIDSGLGNALIQKKDADDLDFSSVFYFNVLMCLVLYFAMFFTAPLISNFYEKPELTPIVRVMSLTLIISGVKNIIHAYISREMMFKKFFKVTLTGTIISAVIGIIMAYNGCGVWALVAQPIANSTIDTVMLWFSVDWWPKLLFSWARLKGLLSYGWKLLAAKLVNVSYENLRDLLIGKFYTPAELAFYNKGSSFPVMIVPNITASVDGVLFPAMAAQQDDKARIKEMVKKSIQISSFLIMPMMTGMIACGRPMIRLLLTEKWLPCLPYLYMFCAVYAFWSFSIANLNAIRALGYSDIMLKIEIIEKVFSLSLLAITFRFGVFWIGISYMAGELFSAAMCAVPNGRLIGYGLVRQIIDIAPILLTSTAMGIITYSIQLLGLSDLLTLVIQVPLGIILYLGLAYCFKLYGFTYFLNFFKTKAIRKKEK